MADVEKTTAQIKTALEPKHRASGRKVDIEFNGSTLKLVDSGSKWVLRGPDGVELAKSLSGLKEALQTFAGLVTPKAGSGDGCQFCGRKIANAGALTRHERACGENPDNKEEQAEEPAVGAKVVVAAALTADQISGVDKAMTTLNSASGMSIKELSIDVGDTGVRVLMSRDSLESAFDITIECGEEEGATTEELGSEMTADEVRARVERMVQSSNEWADSTLEILELLEGGGVRVGSSPSDFVEFSDEDRGLLWDLAEDDGEGEEEDDEEAEGDGEEDDDEEETGEFELPVVGDTVEVKDADEASGWLEVEVAKVRTATFDVVTPSNKTQKIHVKSKDWRPQKVEQPKKDGEEEAHSSSGSRLAKRGGDLVAKATAKVESIDSDATKARAVAFSQKRTELDAKVDPMADDADTQFVANLKAARKHAQELHPSNEKATKVKKAIANVEAKRAELAEAEAELEGLLSDDDDEEPPTKKAKSN